MNSNSNSILKFEDTSKLPSHVDAILQQKIRSYLDEGGTYSKLAQEMDAYVRKQYKDAWDLVEDQLISEAQLEQHIKNHCPKRSYINDYARGRPICFRYTNTIANFFNVQYKIRNFDPAEDLAYSIESRAIPGLMSRAETKL